MNGNCLWITISNVYSPFLNFPCMSLFPVFLSITYTQSTWNFMRTLLSLVSWAMLRRFLIMDETCKMFEKMSFLSKLWEKEMEDIPMLAICSPAPFPNCSSSFPINSILIAKFSGSAMMWWVSPISLNQLGSQTKNLVGKKSSSRLIDHRSCWLTWLSVIHRLLYQCSFKNGIQWLIVWGSHLCLVLSH